MKEVNTSAPLLSIAVTNMLTSQGLATLSSSMNKIYFPLANFALAKPFVTLAASHKSVASWQAGERFLPEIAGRSQILILLVNDAPSKLKKLRLNPIQVLSLIHI